MASLEMVTITMREVATKGQMDRTKVDSLIVAVFQVAEAISKAMVLLVEDSVVVDAAETVEDSIRDAVWRKPCRLTCYLL